ncbi:MAG TPA: hypothetical protein PLU87_00150 [Sedimentisphaerales bacterium]|nr:hypothetical protein [Sedimentisphaerales bacterium]HRS09712.1 hypothetical protein [Sedimentisphaerales bacterium]HRV46393.1 hypothetical protein [Sedimentisphaerales bacterium]
MDYHRRLVDLLKDLRAARARNDGPAVEGAYAKLATHAKSPGMLVHFLHGCRKEWGANLEMDEVVTWLAGEYRSGVRTLCPAAWDHLSTDRVFAELERWLERAGEAAPKTTCSATHSPDFRSVYWYGQTYTFTPSQAACVKVLWESWERKCPDVGDATLLEAAECDTKRLDHLFRDHRAWGAMIVKGRGKGTHRLRELPAKR